MNVNRGPLYEPQFGRIVIACQGVVIGHKIRSETLRIDTSQRHTSSVDEPRRHAGTSLRAIPLT